MIFNTQLNLNAQDDSKFSRFTSLLLFKQNIKEPNRKGRKVCILGKKKKKLQPILQMKHTYS